jgi:mono/diheme cytochrome c family protein
VKQRLKLSFLMAAAVIAFAIVFGTALINSAAANSPAVEPFDAAASYNSKCAKCHGRDGRSKTARGRLTHSRDLTKSDWQDDVSDERIYNSISNGKGKMPPFKKSLTDAQINSLVSYVRSLKR